MSVKIIATRVTALRRLATGTYMGDGAATQPIIGVGFQPRLLLIYRQAISWDELGEKTDQDGVNALFFQGPAVNRWGYQADQIISLDADGFTVGDGTPLALNIFNVNLVIYTYVAFA